jgi:hypothetical protein
MHNPHFLLSQVHFALLFRVLRASVVALYQAKPAGRSKLGSSSMNSFSNLQRRRIGFRVLAFAIFAALLGLAPSAQAQWQGRGPERSGERGPDRGPNNGCDRGDRGPDRGCPARPPENPPPPQQ